MVQPLTPGELKEIRRLGALYGDGFFDDDDVQFFAEYSGAYTDDGEFDDRFAPNVAIALLERLKVRRPELEPHCRGLIAVLARGPFGIKTVGTGGGAGVDATARELARQALAAVQELSGDEAAITKRIQDALDAAVARLGQDEGLIGELRTGYERADTALGERIDAEKTAREGADEALGDRISGMAGYISISPDNIPNREAVIRDYAFAAEGLDEAWLRAKRVDSVDIWLKDTGFHSLSPWAPSENIRAAVNVNANEARAIAIGENESIVPLRAVFRSQGQFVALLTNWLTIGAQAAPAPAGGVTAQQLADLQTRSDEGDEIGVEEIGNAAALVTFFGSQETNENAAWVFFSADVTEVHEGVQHTFKARDLAYYAPRNILGKTVLNVPVGLSVAQAAQLALLTTQARGALLGLNVSPTAVPRDSIEDTYTVSAANPAALPAPGTWWSVQVAGQNVHPRTAWTHVASRNFAISEAESTRITNNVPAGDHSVNVDINFHDAANGGNLLATVRVGLTLIPVADPVVEVADEAAYNALAAKDANTWYWWD